MNIDLPVIGSIKIAKLLGKVFSSGIEIFAGSCIVRKVVPDRFLRQLSLEEVHLVQKEDYRGVFEPREAHDRLKEKQCFLHLILFRGQELDSDCPNSSSAQTGRVLTAVLSSTRH